MPLLELTDVFARYGPIRALHGVSLKVDEGEVVALLGANGAGKTTTLRSISGMTRTSGEITFDGRRITRRSTESVSRLGIAHVPEGRGSLSGADGLGEPADGSRRRRRGNFAEAAERIVEYFPWIERRRDQAAATLSGGEQQMLALGRALVGTPRLLMLDEPSLGLAPTVVGELFAIVRRLNEDDGLTVLVVEQNARIALDVASRAYVLEVGKVAVDGTSEELARHEGVRKSYLGY